MNGGMRQLNKQHKARRRVRMRTALLLTLWAFAAAAFAQALAAIPGLPAWALLSAQAALALLGFGGAAYAGLFVVDGRHTELIPRRVLGHSQGMWYAAAGMLAIAPVSLCQDVMLAFFGLRASAPGAMEPSLFLLMLLKSALLVPAAEELFFRGYLLGALARYGRKEAAAACALVFALMHGDVLILPHAALGLLLGLIVLRTDSLLASVIVHAAYNAAIVLLAYMGLGGLFAGLSFLSCALRVAMTLAFIYAIRRALTARVVRLRFDVPQNAGALLAGMTAKEKLTLAAAAAAVLLAAVITGVL